MNGIDNEALKRLMLTRIGEWDSSIGLAGNNLLDISTPHRLNSTNVNDAIEASPELAFDHG